jgi:tRNA(Ile)-lysidine synthase
MSLIDSTRRTIRRYHLLPRDSRVLVALSGGPDSVGLLYVLRDLAEAEGFRVAGAVHLNHQLRGGESDEDENFCKQLASSLELPIDLERVNVAQLAHDADVSIEQAAHTARHEFYARAALRVNATAVAVAHTRDDQAETFLLRLLRGAGPRGLSGMHPKSGLVVRPLLETRRAEVRAFLGDRHLAFREDASNSDVTIPRNRIRHELLPLLENRFMPGIVDVLGREAAIARDDAEYLDAVAREAASRLISKTAAGVEIAADELLREPRAIARRVVRIAQEMAVEGVPGGFEAAEAILQFVVSKPSGPLDLAGHRVNLRGNRVVLTERRGRGVSAPPADFSYLLDIPGQIAVPEAACAISADIRGVPSGRQARQVWSLTGRGDEAVVEAGRVVAPLSVRNRRPGDRFRPLGLGGRKKLQDFFVDARVERAERDATPIVVDSTGRIVWVAGHALAEEFRVTDHTRAVVILKRVPI